jgi:hypothetical protein
MKCLEFGVLAYRRVGGVQKRHPTFSHYAIA